MPYIEKNILVHDTDLTLGKENTYPLSSITQSKTAFWNSDITSSQSADEFGATVKAGHGVVAVCARSEGTGASRAGSVYLFDYNRNEIKIIRNPQPTTNAYFGLSMDIGCNIIAITAVDSTSAPQAGRVYLYTLGGDLITTLEGPTGNLTDAYFGEDIAVGCGRVVIGARGLSRVQTTGGAVFVYDTKGNFIRELTDPNNAPYSRFGMRIAVGSGRIVVTCGGNTNCYVYDLDGNLVNTITKSSDLYDRPAVGCGRIVIGRYGFDIGGASPKSNAGCIDIYDLDGNTIASNVTASDAAASDELGASVAIGSGQIFVGAPGADPTYSNDGAVYHFDLDGNQIGKLTPATGSNYYAGGIASYGNGIAVDNGFVFIGAKGGRYFTTATGVVYSYAANTTLGLAPLTSVLDLL